MATDRCKRQWPVATVISSSVQPEWTDHLAAKTDCPSHGAVSAASSGGCQQPDLSGGCQQLISADLSVDESKRRKSEFTLVHTLTLPYCSYRVQGRQQGFRPGWANICLIKFGAEKNFSFAHSGFQFAHTAREHP